MAAKKYQDKFVSVPCFRCGAEKLFASKEVTRKKRLGTRFYCSLSCSAHQHNLEYTPTEEHMEHFRDGARRASLGNKHGQKYPREDKFFAETLRRIRQRKQHDTDITMEYLQELWDAQGGRCALSGIPMNKYGGAKDVAQASLDRGYSGRGYIQGNVQFVVLPLNYAKAQLFNNDIKLLINLILKYHDKNVDTLP
jgi:hypothetical protein